MSYLAQWQEQNLSAVQNFPNDKDDRAIVKVPCSELYQVSKGCSKHTEVLFTMVIIILLFLNMCIAYLAGCQNVPECPGK